MGALRSLGWGRTDLGRSTSVCEPAGVFFGESLSAAASTEPAEWIGESIGGEPWTVGSLVPNRYESLARLHAPDPTPDGWWELYRDVFVVVASLGAGYTTTPTRAWFAIWEGHGFDKTTTHVAWRDPPANDAERHRRAAERERLRIADRERNATIGSALAAIPRFALPDRAYYLTQGPLSALADLRYPDFEGWRNPDLFWPHDRSWFAATDVDFWSLYVGGSETFTNELAARASTPAPPFTTTTDFRTKTDRPHRSALETSSAIGVTNAPVMCRTGRVRRRHTPDILIGHVRDWCLPSEIRSGILRSCLKLLPLNSRPSRGRG